LLQCHLKEKTELKECKKRGTNEAIRDERGQKKGKTPRKMIEARTGDWCGGGEP